MRRIIVLSVLTVCILGTVFCYVNKLVELKDILSLFWFIPLTIVALFQDDIKKYLFAPNLRIEFKLEAPYCLKSRITSDVIDNRGHHHMRVSQNTYHFRFRIKNAGKTQAKECECVSERLWTSNTKGEWIEDNTFQNINLNWSNAKSQDGFMNINPNSPAWFCDLVHTEEVGMQSVMHIDYKEPFPNSQLKIIQPNIRYKILVSVYSENTKPVSKTFEIYHSGQWKDKPEEMLDKEVKIA
jgi:hypothetical protein